MTLPLETMRPGQLRLLVLTPDYADFLWLNALLAGDVDISADATWCPDLVDCDDLIRNASFDVIVWDCVFHGGSEASFLQYLAVASNEKPVLALSAEPPMERAPELLAAGAADYLCRQTLDHWTFRRAVKSLGS